LFIFDCSKCLQINNNRMKICTKTRQGMADEYGVNIRTFLSWCKEAGIKLPNGMLYPKKVEEIYEKLGVPEDKGV